MSALHAYFAQRNQHAFQRALEAGRSHSFNPNGSNGPSASGGKSWTRPTGLSMGMSSSQPDINTRDWLGRTVLHLACAATDSAAVEYVRMILSHSGVNVNLQDRESMWTALHRALYHGNIAIAIILLQRTDTDSSLKDLEGYTAFDLYNSTVELTKPSNTSHDRSHLFTWGTNRNATLCLGDDKDRIYPDQVQLRSSEYSQESPSLATRLLPLPIREIAMSKLHTVVLTDEHRHNVRVCGFGSGGRLGAIQHTQYSLTAVPGYGGDTVVATALGQDHTLILTKAGEVYSWGLNRFFQLGYLVEISTAGTAKPEEPVQTTPKKVPTPKNVIVRGIAASKNASACWSAEHLYTWGTNNGQLGYDKAAQPIQISPRVVTKVQKPVIMVAMAENAMACLLETNEVLCFANDRQTKINFPVETFPSEITPYRPPQSVAITKITVSEGTFAALSTKGEVFTFSIPTFAGATPTAITDVAVKPVVIRPQRVWSLRKKFSAATDLALGTDGALAVCTESGHVYVAARGLKGTFSASSKGSKFVRMPGLQRVTRISANSTGGFGALHSEYRPLPIDLEGNTIPEDFATVQPWLKEPDDNGLGKAIGPEPASNDGAAAKIDDDEDDEGEDEKILNDIRIIKQLCDVLRRDKGCRAVNSGRGIFTDTSLGYGADIMIQVGSTFEFPAHRLVQAMRSPILRDILSGGRLKKDSESKINLAYRPVAKAGIPRLAIDGCRPMAALLLMTYLYTDDIPAVWDRRVHLAVEVDLVALGVRTADVKRDLRHLARILELPRLDEALEPLVKRAPVPSLLRDIKALHANVGSLSANNMPQPDVVIKLADCQVQAYSLVLRARSPLFAAFFDTEDWTRQRWSREGTIDVDFSHLKSRPMDFVMRFMCSGEEEYMFEQLDFIQSVDELIDFLFDVIAAANELHLGRLMLVCSRVMVQYINIYNIGYMLSDASYFHTFSLVNRLHGYMAINMETLLEGRLLDNLSAEVVKHLSAYVRSCQATKSPVARSSKIVNNAMLWWGDWLALQDIPEPIVPSARGYALRDNPRLSPPVMMTKRSMEQVQSKRPYLPASVVSALGGEDDVFTMDDTTEASSTPKATLVEPPTTPSKKAAGTWKIGPSTPKADLKSIMAEAKTPRENLPSASSPRAVPPRQLNQANWRAGLSSGDTPPQAIGPVQRVNSGGSPWKAREMTVTPVSGPSGTPGSPSQVPRTRIETYPALGSAPPRPLGSPAKATTSGMGPTIAPTRQASSSRIEGKRSTSTSGKVWSSPAPQPSVEPMPAASGLSFADIQAIQIAQAQPVEKDKRSLLEIQEEERARQEENDFLRWWAEEEARTKAEMDGAAAVANPSESKKRRSRKPKESRDAPASGSDSLGAPKNPSTKNGDRPPQSRKPSRADQPTNGAPLVSQSTANPAGPNGSGLSRRGGPHHRGASHNGHGSRTAPQAQAT